MILEGVLLLLQIALLVLLVAIARQRAAHPLERAFNPAALLCFFYVLWMLIPQAYALLPAHAVIGLEHVPSDLRFAAVLPTQGLLLVFLGCLTIGYATVLGLFSPAGPAKLYSPPLQPTQWHYGLATYAVGIAAFFVLGRTLEALPDGTMRSALVKNTAGQIMMTLSFFGSFGVAYLCAHGWLRGQRLRALVLFLLYAWLVLQLGARGRILWPAVTALLFVWGQTGQLRTGRLLIMAVLALATLSLLDPLVYGLRNDDYARLRDALSPLAMLETLFYGRNFDGFANLLFINQQDRIPEQASLLFSGSRDVYMNTYYPDIYAMGVAFPTTVPGEFWLAGRLPLLTAMSLLYGAALALFQLFARHARRESQLWIYLLLLPWVTAVGGELVESLQKMMAACAPAVLWMLAGSLWPSQSSTSAVHHQEVLR